MIPSSVSAFFGFLFLVAPGVAYEIHRERRRPALQQSAFREGSRVALWSLIFTTAAVAVLVLGRLALPRVLPDLQAWLTDQDYAKDHPRSVGTFIVAEVALAQVMAWTVAGIVGRRDRGRIHQGDIWHKIFAADVPRDREVQAVILTKNAEYRGTVVGYTVNADISNRELELRHVTFRMRSDEEAQPQYLPAPFDRVVVASAAVEEMWLHYRNEIEPRPPWWKRLVAGWERRRNLRAMRIAARRTRRTGRSGEVEEQSSSEQSGDRRSNRPPSPQRGARATTPSASATDHTTDGWRQSPP